MKRSAILLAILALLLLTHIALAMESTNYKLDWFVPLTGGGGGPSSSTNYEVDFTVGQTAIGAADSDNYAIGQGYWYGVLDSWLFLPLVLQ